MRNRIAMVMMLAPALIVGGGLFLVAFAEGLVSSLGMTGGIGEAEFTVAAYVKALTSTDTYHALAHSLFIATLATILSSALAIAAAMWLRGMSAGRSLITFLFKLNLAVPHSIGAVGMLYLLSQSGFFARIATAANIIAEPADFPALVFDPFSIAIILEYVWKEVPFIALILLANMQVQAEAFESTARTLGASRWQTFRHVTFPTLRPSLLSAAAIVFAFSFGAYEVPLLLAKSYPLTLPVQAFHNYTDPDLAARPEAMALAIIVTVVSVTLLVVLRRLFDHQGQG